MRDDGLIRIGQKVVGQHFYGNRFQVVALRKRYGIAYAGKRRLARFLGNLANQALVSEDDLVCAPESAWRISGKREAVFHLNRGQGAFGLSSSPHPHFFPFISEEPAA